MPVQPISPAKAYQLIFGGAVLVDIREEEEFVDEHIPGAVLMPLSKFEEADLAPYRGKVVLFYCRSGRRTREHCLLLADKARECTAFAVEGGLLAWREQAFPTVGGELPERAGTAELGMTSTFNGN